MLATAGSDGYVRLFDVRTPLPAITFNAGGGSEFCLSVILVHPDGIPTVFSGGMKSEQIKMWDVRTQAAVYELATGNNEVNSMAWDDRRSTLYAATECSYMDRLGYTHDYRRARLRKRTKNERKQNDNEDAMGEDAIMDDDSGSDYADGDDSDEDDEDGYDGKCWPKNAYHSEEYFGHIFDAGDHRLYAYTFKADADPSGMPSYGNAILESEMQW